MECLKQLLVWSCLKGEFIGLCLPAKHEHEPFSELSKQSLLLSESDYDTIDGSPKTRPHIPSPLVSSSFAPESPPGYVWYIELSPPNWKWLGVQISRNTPAKHPNHLHLLSSNYSSKQYDHETSQLCQRSTSVILHISQHELLHPIIIYHNDTERWMGRRSGRWFWVWPPWAIMQWFEKHTDNSSIEWVSQPFANLILSASEDTNVL